jgi:hypothetical protein
MLYMKTTDTAPLPSKQVKDIRGQRFARLVVLSYDGRNKSGGALWLCVCDCGAEVVVPGGHLRSGHTRSCGCLHIETVRTVNVTHRMIHTPEYRSWAHIRSRCTNPNVPAYPNYGGRGIVMCDRWLNSFENFYADLGPKPTPAHTIERIDNDGPYAPDNCKWATRIEQANNKRSNVFVTYQGITQSVPDWCRQLGLPYARISTRIEKGMPPEEAFSSALIANTGTPRLLTYDGKTMSLTYWARHIGITDNTLRQRLRKGWSLERALTAPLDLSRSFKRYSR